MSENMPSEDDIREACKPKSTQLNFEDVQSSPIDVRIVAVTRGTAEQPVSIAVEGQQPYLPCKTMRRALVAAWGTDARQWVGRRMRLYGDPTVKFGGVAVGGIRISHLSDISQPLELKLSVSRGKRVVHRIDPLADRLPKFRAWLKTKGLSEQDATAAIDGTALETATDEQWDALRKWAKETELESKGQEQ